VSISRSGTSKDATDGVGLGKATFRAIDVESRFSVVVTRLGPNFKPELAMMHHSMLHEIMNICKPVFHFLDALNGKHIVVEPHTMCLSPAAHAKRPLSCCCWLIKRGHGALECWSAQCESPGQELEQVGGMICKTAK